jgi:D-amino peptidase
MKVYISIDMEGIAGIATDADVSPTGAHYEYCRKLMTEECNAAIQGAFEAGATEVLVNDSHWTMLNLLQKELDRRATVIRGLRKPYDMVQGIDEDTSAAMFIGYHAAAGHGDGVMNHTMEGTVREVLLNDEPAGESRLNAAFAGWLGVPVVLVSGDNVVCQEVRDFLEDVETVEVKQAVDEFTALSLHPEEAQDRIREAAARALGRLKDFSPYRVATPTTMRVSLTSTSMAALCEGVPGVKRVASRDVEYVSSDYKELYRLLGVLLALAGSVGSTT